MSQPRETSALLAFWSVGDSLSDPGNAFALTGEQSVPPYDTLDPFLVPSAPYARGGHHLSNGATWVEQLGKTLKVNKSVVNPGSSPASRARTASST